MSILIKGMEMPPNCMDCPFKGFDRAGGRGNICTINDSITLHAVLDGVDIKFVRMGDCPLVPVPSHGRLGDLDALMQHVVLLPRDGGHLPIVYASYVRNAPTIIPAEEGKTMSTMVKCDKCEKINEAHNEGYDVGYWAGRRDYEPKWIPVTERLPEEWCPVLGLIQYCDEEAPPAQIVLWYLGNGHWRETWRGDMIASAVTHWMSLPEPPKEAER